MSIYKQCDIRGPYGTELQNFHAERLGQAIASFLGSVTVLVAGDGRLSTPALKENLINALSQGGCNVVDLGQVPTPVFNFARDHLSIRPGVMITGSHNPAQDNGFKVILGHLPISPEELTSLTGWMEGAAQITAFPKGKVEKVNVLEDYLDFVRSQAPDLSGMRVVVDCANGMTSLTAHPAWEATGADVTFLFDEVDGTFPNHLPNPAVAANLQALQQAVMERGADFGVAYDGDGDRVAFVDSLGRPLGNDKAIVLFVEVALENEKSPIVYDQKCSRIVPETIRRLGGEPVVERSGHTFIKRTFISLNAPYAGEVSGHHFFRSQKGDDGLLASFYMARLLRKKGCSLAELSERIRTYPITPDIRLKMDNATVQQILIDLAANLEGKAKLSHLDGLRADFSNGWGMARPSVTEALITLRFEANSRTSLRRIMEKFIQAAPKLAGLLTLPDDGQAETIFEEETE